MWVYYYISKKRIAQLAYQINPRIPRELISKWDVKGNSGSDIDLNRCRLFEIIGIKGTASANLAGNVSRSSERKITIPEAEIVDTVCSYLLKSDNCTFIDTNSTTEKLNSVRDVVRFRGAFSPMISGENAAERIASYWEAKSFSWEGQCGEITVSFTTTRESFDENHTPVLGCLKDVLGTLRLDGFGLINSVVCASRAELIPLFFGLEISV
jgi:hypothetical protein